jgi:hypothetical protein
MFIFHPKLMEFLKPSTYCIKKLLLNIKKDGGIKNEIK